MNEARGGEPFKTSLAVLTLVAGLAAAVLGYFEYKANLQDRRVERVMRYADLLRGKTEGYREYSTTLGDFSLVYWKYLDTNSADAERFVTDSINADRALREAVTGFTRFFDLLTVCIAEDLCDERTARALFVHDLEEFHNITIPWLSVEQQQYNAHGGKPLICLRNHFRKSKPPAPPPVWQIARPAGPCAGTTE
jgi:hypothetical protein